jgi:predicted phage-related endonuclease
MKINKYENREEWLAARRGKITGSKLGDVISFGGYTKEAIVSHLKTAKVEFNEKAKKEELEAFVTPEMKASILLSLPKKLGYYELIADRMGVAADDESSSDRGTRLEPEAIERFTKETGKKVDTSLVIWAREDNEAIAISPDGFIGKKVAVECKCLSSARHIEALITKKIPSEYEFQKLQYFIVNDDLQTLYFAFYDPRIVAKDFFVIEVKRKDIQDQVDTYLAYEKALLEEIKRTVNELTF